VTLQWAVRSVENGALDMERHEEDLWPALEGLLPEGGVLIDIGANMGLWTVRLGGRASRVIAVEANPAAAAVLRQNITLNGLDGTAEVLQAAAWDSDEPLSFLNPAGPNEPMAGLMRVVPAGGGEVRGRRLDDALPALDRIDLVKVDTEGADIRALAGMTATIAAHKPVLFVESHHQYPYGYYELEDLTGFIASIGYTWSEARWGSQLHLICHPGGTPS
jgi:FkbM family methyltransferase